MSIVGLKRISKSPEAMVEIGREIGKLLPKDSTVCLEGELGAGKTTLVKGIVSEITTLPIHEVNSPTFTYLNIYEGRSAVYHFDCYRLSSAEEFLQLGLDDYFGALCLIEWPSRIFSLLPNKRVHITIHHLEGERREVQYEEYSI